MIIVFDIDGTLSKVGDRVKCLEQTPPNWDEFYDRCDEDEPCWPVINTYQALLDNGHDMILLTGRRESTRQKTANWLLKNGVHCYSTLLMRRDGDYRHDTIIKPEILSIFNIRPDLVFEDRSSMVKMWRENGITCFQVAEGEF